MSLVNFYNLFILVNDLKLRPDTLVDMYPAHQFTFEFRTPVAYFI
jgi:hypothetical protein